MEKVSLYRADFEERKFTFHNGFFYKIIDDVKKENLIHLSCNKDKLTEDLYIFPNGFYETLDYRLVFQTDIFENHKTLDELIYLQMSLDVERIATSLATVLTELESIGLIYYDFHGGNVLMDKFGNIKVCDLDSSLRIKTEVPKWDLSMNELYNVFSNKLTSRKLFFSFILELMTIPEDYKSSADLITYETAVKKLNIMECFNSDVSSYLTHLFDLYESVLNENIFDILSMMFDATTKEKIAAKVRKYNICKQY